MNDVLLLEEEISLRGYHTMNTTVYEVPTGVLWSMIVTLFVMAAVVIIYLWNKTGQGKR